MPSVPNRFAERAKSGIRKYQRVLDSAKKRDVNESDTSVIVKDMLSDILGYDKYEDITTEVAIRSTYCDLAIRVKGRLQYLIEVKSIGTDLKDNHLRQAIEYGSREGVEWVLLTNGAVWQAHRIRFEQPIDHDMVFSVDLLGSETKPSEIVEKLYLVSKDAGNASQIDLYWKHKEATSRYVVAQLLMESPALAMLRRQLRALFPGLKVSEDEIEELLRNEVVKRDAFEGDRAVAAEKMVQKAERRRRRAAGTSDDSPMKSVSGTAALPSNAQTPAK
jgi:predicted type IV restriction endonuclease